MQKILQKNYHLVVGNLDKLEALELVTYLKGSRNNDRARLTKKGKTLLKTITKVNFNEDISSLTGELVEVYESLGKPTGNTLEVENRLAWFVQNTAFSNEVIIQAVTDYLLVSKYIKRLDNLVWTPPSKAFSIHMNLKDSTLYDLICKKYSINPVSFIKPKKDKYWKWLFEISKLKVPKKQLSKVYFTGSAKGDEDHLKSIKRLLLNEIQNL